METSSSKERHEVEKTIVREKEKKIDSVGEDVVNEKVLSWMETAARAGVITMVTRTAEEESDVAQTMTQKKKNKNAKRIQAGWPQT